MCSQFTSISFSLPPVSEPQQPPPSCKPLPRLNSQSVSELSGAVRTEDVSLVVTVRTLEDAHVLNQTQNLQEHQIYILSIADITIKPLQTIGATSSTRKPIDMLRERGGRATTTTCLTPVMGFCLGRPLAICCFCLSCNALLSTARWEKHTQVHDENNTNRYTMRSTPTGTR
ncbi:hypothetical protein F7725_008677 [Dissostichus mawsoni]|uniref:Uncharacterized protein n=1 Tax=Dissostichus mawsoni TaxID=36200 RepID=A0A7J5Y7U9_DISMA|nr:hypothetical protein F7725_008677 [Dissostichus mawsoni]